MDLLQGMPSTHADDYPLNTTTLIRHAARTSAEQQIVYRTADGDWDTYTYADAFRRIAQQAHALERLGIGPGDVVGVLDWNSRRFFELYWSIPGIAAVMLQMNLRLGAADLGYVTDHAGARMVFVDESLISVAEELVALAPGVERWIIMSDRPATDISTTLPNAVHFEDLIKDERTTYDWALIAENSAYSACYTTGTTGRPKGVYYSHRGIYLHAMMQARAIGMHNADSVCLITPMFHGNCWGLPQSAVLSEAKVVLPGRYTADGTEVLVDAMIREGVTVANGAPAIFGPMLDYIKSLPQPPDLSHTRLLSGATEPPVSLMRGFHELTGADIIHGYGATETTPMVSLNAAIKASLRDSLDEDQKWDLKRKQGLLVNGVDFRLIDSDGNDLPFDGEAQGEILLRGPWIIDRYHNLEEDPAQAAARFHDGYWRSGDVGRIGADGYLKLTDRLKDVVKSGGEWISSIDMENLLTSHPKIADAGVIGVPHPKWQERPLALVVTDPADPVTLGEVHELLSEAFAKWQLPERLIILDELPRTSVGKLDKKRMRVDWADVYRDVPAAHTSEDRA